MKKFTYTAILTSALLGTTLLANDWLPTSSSSGSEPYKSEGYAVIKTEKRYNDGFGLLEDRDISYDSNNVVSAREINEFLRRDIKLVANEWNSVGFSSFNGDGSKLKWTEILSGIPEGSCVTVFAYESSNWKASEFCNYNYKILQNPLASANIENVSNEINFAQGFWLKPSESFTIRFAVNPKTRGLTEFRNPFLVEDEDGESFELTPPSW